MSATELVEAAAAMEAAAEQISEGARLMLEAARTLQRVVPDRVVK